MSQPPHPAAVRRGPGRLRTIGAASARLARLLTAAVLLGTAPLIVALAGQGVAGARLLPPPPPPVHRSPPAPRPGDADAAAATTPALQRSLAAAHGVLAQPADPPPAYVAQAATAADQQAPAGRDRPGVPAPQGDTAPQWWMALRREQPQVADLLREIDDGEGDDPATPEPGDLPPGSVLAAGPAALLLPKIWVRWSREAERNVRLLPVAEADEPDLPARMDPVWPGVRFHPGTALPERDREGNLVVPWGQVKFLRDGGWTTYDRSRRLPDGTLWLAPQPKPVVDGGITRYANGVIDYRTDAGTVRYLSRTETWITADGRILVPDGEVLPDGSLSAERFRVYTDGSRVIDGEWHLWGGLRVDTQGRVFGVNGRQLNVDAGPVYADRGGTRVHAGGIVDFANGDTGYPGGVRVAANLAMPAQPVADQPVPSLENQTPQELQQRAQQLEAELGDFRYQRERLVQRPDSWTAEVTRRESDLLAARAANQAEYEQIRKLVPYPPQLDDVPTADLEQRAESLRSQLAANRGQLLQVTSDTETLAHQRRWQEIPLQDQQDRLQAEHDQINQSLWGRLEAVRRQKAELGAPGSADAWDRFRDLDAQENALAQAYEIGKAAVPYPRYLLAGDRDQNVAEARSVWDQLQASRDQLAQLSGPASAERSRQYADLESRIRTLQKHYDELWAVLGGPSDLPPPRATTSQQAAASGEEPAQAPDTRLAGADAVAPGVAPVTALDTLQPQDPLGQPSATAEASAPAPASATILAVDADHDAAGTLVQQSGAGSTGTDPDSGSGTQNAGSTFAGLDASFGFSGLDAG